MACPILLNIRVIESVTPVKDNVMIAVNQFGFGAAESGFLAQCGFLATETAKWGATVVETRGSNFSYFSPERMNTDKVVFERALSFLLNEWYSGEKGRSPYFEVSEIDQINDQVLILAVDPSSPKEVYFIKSGVDQVTLSAGMASIIESFRNVPAYVVAGDTAKGAVDAIAFAEERKGKQGTKTLQ